MKIVEPNVELWKQGDIEEYDFHIARCARVCYKSDKVDGNKQLVERLINSKHYSVFRHWTYYCIIPVEEYSDEYDPVDTAFKCNRNVGFESEMSAGFDKVFAVYNGQWALENPKYDNLFAPYRVTPEEFEKAGEDAHWMMRYTFCVTTQISTSRELNRVSPNNITEESTRYVTEGEICRPHWIDKGTAIRYNAGLDNIDAIIVKYLNSCKSSVDTYNDLIEAGLKRQDARGVLPLDTKTTVVYTYSTKEWFDIIKKRVYHTTGKAHPNATIICKLIEQELNELGYEIKI